MALPPAVSHYDRVIGILWNRIGTRLDAAKFPADQELRASDTVR